MARQPEAPGLSSPRMGASAGFSECPPRVSLWLTVACPVKGGEGENKVVSLRPKPKHPVVELGAGVKRY